MTGYRLGYAVGHPDLIAGLKKCKGQIDSGAPIFIQKAGIAALGMYGDDGELPKEIADNLLDEIEEIIEAQPEVEEIDLEVYEPQVNVVEEEPVRFDFSLPELELYESVLPESEQFDFSKDFDCFQ